MRNRDNIPHLGRLVYGEWLIPIVHYYKVIKKNEMIFEVAIPVIIAIFSTLLYTLNNNIIIAINKLEEMLPNVLAILIGFTISCIAMLTSADLNQIPALKFETDRRVKQNEKITLHRLMLINFTYSLIIQVFFLIGIFVAAYLVSMIKSNILYHIILVIEVFATILVLLILIRMITNLYCIYIKPK